MGGNPHSIFFENLFFPFPLLLFLRTSFGLVTTYNAPLSLVNTNKTVYHDCSRAVSCVFAHYTWSNQRIAVAFTSPLPLVI